MLFRQSLWPGLADGSITVTFRRWRRPQARVGGRYRTPAGVLEVDTVTVLAGAEEITDADARRSGYAGRAELLADLDRHSDGAIYRVEFHHAGPDPREALHEAEVGDREWGEISARLDRLDRASRHGPWTATVLRLIADHPGVRAADLAASIGRDRDSFKIDVRKLKEMGLTESLEIGYRVSPRGQAVLDRLTRAAGRQP